MASPAGETRGNRLRSEISRRACLLGIAGISLSRVSAQNPDLLDNRMPLEGGTVIVVAYSRKHIVVAADSKASFRTDGFQDDVCKVSMPTNKLAFAAAGLVGVGDWHASDLARNVAARIVGDNPYLSESSLQSVAEAWTRAMTEKIRLLPPELVLKQRNESQTAAIFAALDRADDVNLVRATVEPVSSGNGLDARTNIRPIPNTSEETRYLVFGRPDIAKEFLDGKSERARAEIAKWSSYFAGSSDMDEDIAIRLVELTSYFDERKDLVGGPTAAIRIDGNGGVRWLRRPPNCLR